MKTLLASIGLIAVVVVAGYLLGFVPVEEFSVADNSTPECGSRSHKWIMKVWNDAQAPGAPRMIDVWADKEASSRKDDPANVQLRCLANAKFNRGGDWAIRYVIYEERGKAFTRVKQERPLN